MIERGTEAAIWLNYDEKGRPLTNGVVVCDWVEAKGGAVRVYEAMAEAFPEASLLALWSDRPEGVCGRPVKETWLSAGHLRRHKAAALPAMLPTWRGRPGAYDWALVASHLFAHHVDFRGASPNFKKLTYVHTPARYVWEPEIDPRGNHRIARAASRVFREIDRTRAHESTAVATNSRFVKQRVLNTWGCDATVIYPPVETERLGSIADWPARLAPSEMDIYESLPADFLLGASRFVPYKRLEGAIQAGEATGMPVVIAGAGPEEGRLRARAVDASVPVRFVVEPEDDLLFAVMQRASALIFLALEDFGIVPVESMALGTPVVALPVGGAAETVVPGISGEHVPDPYDSQAMRRAVESALDVSPETCRQHAQRFSRTRFVRELREWVSDYVK